MFSTGAGAGSEQLTLVADRWQQTVEIDTREIRGREGQRRHARHMRRVRRSAASTTPPLPPTTSTIHHGRHRKSGNPGIHRSLIPRRCEQPRPRPRRQLCDARAICAMLRLEEVHRSALSRPFSSRRCKEECLAGNLGSSYGVLLLREVGSASPDSVTTT